MHKSLAKLFLNLSEMTGENQLLHDQVYKVAVDCSLTLVQMAQRGQFQNVDEFLDDAIKGSGLIIEGVGQYDALIHLVRFNTDLVDNDDADWFLQKKNLRVARIEEILALGSQFPDVQRKMRIAGRARSSFGEDPNDPFYTTVYLDCVEGNRTVEVEHLDATVRAVSGHPTVEYFWACVPIK